MDHVFTVTFRGTRGSVPVPGSATQKYGGNTSCVQVDVLGHTVILDAGTGIIPLGQQLVKNFYAGGDAAKNKRLSCVLLLSHTHHDHLTGFPFFAPLYIGNANLFIYGPPIYGPVADDRSDLKHVLETLMDPMFFPIDMRETNSRKIIETLQPFDQILLTEGGGEPELVNLQKDYKVTFKDKVIISQYRSLAHPKNGVLIYKLQYGGKSIVYATDIEGYVHSDKRLVQFAKGADLLIHDSQYTEEQYTGSFTTQGFGHSTAEMACQLALEAGVRQLVLFHHDPNHNDEMVAKKEETARMVFPNAVAAQEGQVINL